MHQVVLLIGGNLGDREQLITQARGLLPEIGTIAEVSSIYETQAWGKASKGNYLNQAIIIKTHKSPGDILKLTKKIENKLGRTRNERWGNRTMDIDLIYFDDLIYQDENLIIPHPLMAERKFVLIPLVEIMPDYVHPVFHISNQELLRGCTDQGEVIRYRYKHHRR